MMRTDQGRRALLAAAVLALVIWAGWWVWENKLRPRHPVGPTVRLATWNLRQFSPERPHVDLRAIANVIVENRFDVIAIEEVKRGRIETKRPRVISPAP